MFTDLNTDFNRKQEIYTIEGHNYVQIDWILDTHSDSTRPPALFLIVCSVACIDNILKKVCINSYYMIFLLRELTDQVAS